MKYEEAIKIIQDELKKDKSGGSMFYSWQSNIAMTIMDMSDLDHKKCNEIAIAFLNKLID
jgi:hypothetical protein